MKGIMIMSNGIRGLRFIRELHKISLERLAETLGVSKSLAAKWENGDRKISLATQHELNRIFHIPEEYFAMELNDEIQKEIKTLIDNNQDIPVDLTKRESIIETSRNSDLDDILFRRKRRDLTDTLTFGNIDIYLGIQQILSNDKGNKVINAMLAAAHDYLNIPSLRVAAGDSDYENGVINRNDPNISRLVEDMKFLKES
jgi:transcriptional regulator with XRE-family HTH domain